MRVHATCVVIGEAGVLIRGPAGSGKSKLARELLSLAERLGTFARLVADDRTEIEVRGGRLIARSVASIEGQIEVRAAGIFARDFEPAAVVRLVVDCGSPGDRLPSPEEASAVIEQIRLPRVAHSGATGFGEVVLWRLRSLDDPTTTV
jgi:HPr kinase/phosphorylase